MENKLKVFCLDSPKSKTGEKTILKCIKSYTDYDEENEVEDSAIEGQLSLGVSKYCDLEYFIPQQLYFVNESGKQSLTFNDLYLVHTYTDELKVGKIIFEDFDVITSDSLRFSFEEYDTIGKVVATSNREYDRELPMINESFIKDYAYYQGVIKEVGFDKDTGNVVYENPSLI